MASSRLIPIRVGDIEIEAETVLVAGTEPTSSRASKIVENASDAFDRAQETIIAVARSTAASIDRMGVAARPDRVDLEIGLKFSVSGGVVLAGVASEASLKATFSYDVAARPGAGPS